MRLASEVNKYLDRTAPWKTIKTDRSAAGRSVYAALCAINNLKVIFSPFLPFSCEQLHAIFGYDQPLFGSQYVETVTDSLGSHRVLRYSSAGASGAWQKTRLEPGRVIRQPVPLYKKLEPSIAEEERSRLGK
jgi:methionyl-tRNA synthetase